jgi:hypothetical protein
MKRSVPGSKGSNANSKQEKMSKMNKKGNTNKTIEESVRLLQQTVYNMERIVSGSKRSNSKPEQKMSKKPGSKIPGLRIYFDPEHPIYNSTPSGLRRMSYPTIHKTGLSMHTNAIAVDGEIPRNELVAHVFHYVNNGGIPLEVTPRSTLTRILPKNQPKNGRHNTGINTGIIPERHSMLTMPILPGFTVVLPEAPFNDKKKRVRSNLGNNWLHGHSRPPNDSLSKRRTFNHSLRPFTPKNFR